MLIVPGLHGSKAGHWQRWWQADNSDAHFLEQADWSNPDEASWLDSLEKAVMRRPGCLLIGHSLGAILSAKLGQRPVAQMVKGALLVAPADIERTSTLHQRSYEFGEMPADRLPFPTVVVASRNDHYMAFDKIAGLAHTWGSRFVDLGNVGHINIESGFGRWVKGYELARTLG
jgi:predicted alpha/beta hydrolase family esterase